MNSSEIKEGGERDANEYLLILLECKSSRYRAFTLNWVRDKEEVDDDALPGLPARLRPLVSGLPT